MNERKRERLINAAGIALLVAMLAVMFWLASGCARSEDRNNPCDPKSSTYVVTETPEA